VGGGYILIKVGELSKYSLTFWPTCGHFFKICGQILKLADKFSELRTNIRLADNSKILLFLFFIFIRKFCGPQFLILKFLKN